MKYNINVIKSVWSGLPKPSQATLDAIYSKNAVYTPDDCDLLTSFFAKG